MLRARAALVVLNLASVLIIAGGLYDLSVTGLPSHQASFVGVPENELNPRFVALYLAVFRALGGCLLAVGAVAVFLINGPLRRGEKWSAIALVTVVGLAEGVNSIQMYGVDSPYWAPLIFIGLIVLGLTLAYAPSPAFKRRL